MKIAASLILLRPTASSFQVLMVKRSENIRLGGFNVFPGGMLDAQDSTAESFVFFNNRTEPSPHIEGIDAVDLTALKICALRETYEETGILLFDSAVPAGLTFLDACRQSRGGFNLARLSYFYRVLTPRIAQDRYDTTFFLSEVGPDAQITLNPDECKEYAWVEPLFALNEYMSGSFKMLPPQVLSLFMLAHFPNYDSVAQGLSTMQYNVEWPEFVPEDKAICLTGDYRHSRTVPEIKEMRLENYIAMPGPSSSLRVRINTLAYPCLARTPFKLEVNEGQYCRLKNPRL